MKRSIVLLPLLLLPLNAAAGPERYADLARAAWLDRFQQAREGPEVTDRFSKTVRLGPNGSFELTNVSGKVVVTGGTGTDVRIDAVKRVRHRDAAEARRALGDLRIEVNELPSRVEVRAIYPGRERFSGSVDFTIVLPAGASASIRTISGDISLSNIKGEVRAESVSGNVSASGTPRLSQVRSVSGDVRIRDGATDGELGAQTVSGNLFITASRVRQVEAATVSGDMQLDGLECDHARVRSISGNVEFTGPLAKSGRYDFTSHSGSLRLIVTSGTGFEVDANTFSGNLRSVVQLAERGGREGRGRGRDRSLRGTFGDGSALLTLRTFSGDVVISRK